MIIRTNARANTTHNALRATDVATRRSAQRLSSGLRINSASDDAAGLGVSEKMRAQINGLSRATRNVRDGVSMTQIAEGAMQRANDILMRVRDLTVQAANDSYTTEDRMNIINEVEWLLEEINQIANNTEFNGIPLLGGNWPSGVFGLMPPAPGSPNINGPHIDNINDLLRYLQGGDMTGTGLRNPWPGTPGTPFPGPGGAFGAPRPPVNGNWVINNIPGVTNIHITREQALEDNRNAVWSWLYSLHNAGTPAGSARPWPADWNLRVAPQPPSNRAEGQYILDNINLLTYSDIQSFMTNPTRILELFYRDHSPDLSDFDTSMRDHFGNWATAPGQPPLTGTPPGAPGSFAPGVPPLAPPVIPPNLVPGNRPPGEPQNVPPPPGTPPNHVPPGATLVNGGFPFSLLTNPLEAIPGLRAIETTQRDIADNHNRDQVRTWLLTTVIPNLPAGITMHPDWQTRLNSTNFHNQGQVDNFFNETLTPPVGQYTILDMFEVDRVAGWAEIQNQWRLPDFERDFLISSTHPINSGQQFDRFNQIMFANRLTSINSANAWPGGARLVPNYRQILAGMVSLGTFSSESAFNTFMNGLVQTLFDSNFPVPVPTQIQAALGLGGGNPWLSAISTSPNTFAVDQNQLVNNPQWIVDANNQALRDLVNGSSSHFYTPPHNGFNLPPGFTLPNPGVVDNFFNGSDFTNTAILPGIGVPNPPGISQNAPSNSIRDWLLGTGPTGSSTPNLYNIFEEYTPSILQVIRDTGIPIPPTTLNIYNDWDLINRAHWDFAVWFIESQPWGVANTRLEGWSLQPDWRDRLEATWPRSGITNPNDPQLRLTELQVLTKLNQIINPDRAVHTNPGEAAPGPAIGNMTGPFGPAVDNPPNNNSLFVFAYPQRTEWENAFPTIPWVDVQTTLHPRRPPNMQGGAFPGMNPGFPVWDGPIDAFTTNRNAVVNWIVDVLGGPLFRSDYLFDSRLIDISLMFNPPSGGTGGQDAVADWLNSINFDNTFINRADFEPDPIEMVIQAGANSREQIHLRFEALTLPALGISRFAGELRRAIDIEDGGAISRQINAVVENMDRAIENVVARRSIFGAKMNRMEFTSDNLQISNENKIEANSRIRDADMAQESIARMQAAVLQEASTMMMSQSQVDHIRAAALLFASIPGTSAPQNN